MRADAAGQRPGRQRTRGQVVRDSQVGQDADDRRHPLGGEQSHQIGPGVRGGWRSCDRHIPS